MEFKRILQYLLLTLMPIYLVTGCGDLEPEMQETRTVILKMDYDQRSSSRTSRVFEPELSQYNTHLILALPPGTTLTSNYENRDSSFAQGLMNTVNYTVSLEIPRDKLDTEMKIFAFLFQETPTEFDSGTRTLGYYGESDNFSIGHLTDNFSTTICLIQVPGTPPCTGGDNDSGSDDYGNTDTTAPTVSSISPTDNQSSVSVSDNISLTFSEIMDNSSITTNTDNTSCYGSFQVSSDNFSTCVQMSSSPSISNSAKTFTFDPSDNLSYDNKYKIKLTTDTKDENGVSLESPYETSFNTFDNSLVAYYPFNGNANDLTSNGRNLEFHGDPTLVEGKDNSSNNSAYSFDGVGDYLETENIPSFNNYTISLWAKPASSGTYEAMFSSDNNSGRGFQIDLDGSNFRIRIAGGGSLVLGTALLNGDWTFIAFTYDGTNYIGYMNDNITESVPGGTTEFDRFRIGRNRNGNTYFAGAIDELKIYNRALTASEISSLYAN